MALSFVQGNFLDQSASSTTTAVAYLSNQVLGNTNIIWVLNASGTPGNVLSTLADSQGNTYTQIAGPFVNGIQGPIYCFMASGIKAGANTVTATWSAANTFTEVVALEYSGQTILDGSNVENSTTATTITSPVLQAPLFGDSLLMYFRTVSGVATLDARFTQRTASVFALASDFLNVPQGAYTATCTTTVSGILFIILIALQPFPSSYISTSFGVGRIL